MTETGDLVDLRQREGNVHTADGALEFLLPLVNLVEREMSVKAAVRIDAGFPGEELLSGLEERVTDYVARLRNNAVLDRSAQPHMDARPDREGGLRTRFFEGTYRAGTWSRDRRVVLVVQEKEDQVIPHHFWLVTSWPAARIPGWHLLDIYRQRGTAEGLMGEFMSVVGPMLSSSPRPKNHSRGKPPEQGNPSVNAFLANEARLLLAALTYNAMHVAGG